MKATTQKFVEIEGVMDDVLILSGKRACLILEVKAANFNLMNKDEQDARIASYAALLNSLSFPIQIVIRSKKLDISSYLKLLEGKENETLNPNLKERIKEYRSFIGNLVKVNTVLDKKFYIAIPYSFLEKPGSDFVSSAKSSLHSKAESLKSQLTRLSIPAKVLRQEELVRLFYELYNEDKEAYGTS
jgi:hypothetical protein